MPTPKGPISYMYKDATGQEKSIDSEGLRAQLMQLGYPIAGNTGDGLTYHFNDPRGEYTMSGEDILKNLGHEVTGKKPNGADESAVNTYYRAAISRLPDDDAKKAFLEAKLKRDMNVIEPKVIGQGRDWHYFDPTTNQWKALTNTEHWGKADLAEGAMELGHGIGNVGGGILGSAAGPIGTVGGAAVGGAAAEGAMRGGLAAYDEDFRNATTLGTQLKDVGIGTGIDAAGGALLGGGAHLASKFITPGAEEGMRYLARSGPVSTALKGAGKVISGGGQVADAAGTIAKQPLAKEAIKAFTPGLSQVQMATMLAEAPEMAAVGGAKAAKAFGESSAAPYLMSEEGRNALGKTTGEMLQSKVPSKLEKFNQWARTATGDNLAGVPAEPEIKASGVMRTLGQKGAKALGLSEEAGAKYGQKAGNVMESLGNVARGVDKASGAAIDTGASLVKGAGKTADVIGKGMQAVGNVTQPFESASLASAGARDKLAPFLRDKLMEADREALKRKLDQSSMLKTMASESQ